MEQELKEMILLVRPTTSSEQISSSEIQKILNKLGMEPLVPKAQEIKEALDPNNSGSFTVDSLTTYLMEHFVQPYTDPKSLRAALNTFDYDQDGKLSMEEFTYFMKNFGESENFYMDETKMKNLFKMGEPLDSNGNIDIEVLVSNISGWYTRIHKKK